MGNICSDGSDFEEPLGFRMCEIPALLGDFGGTNLRLSLRRVNLVTRKSTEIIPVTIYKSDGYKSIEECLSIFLKVRDYF